MRGHSRPKDGVASLAYDPRIYAIARHAVDLRAASAAAPFIDGRLDPAIHERVQRRQSQVYAFVRRLMDPRVKRAGDGVPVARVCLTKWKMR